MAISGPGSIDSPQALQGPHSTRPAARPQSAAGSAAAAPADRLEISPEAAQAADAAAAGEVRTDRVAEIRSQIASGSYETPEKLDAALDRLLDEIG